MNEDMTINVMRLGWYNVQQHHELQYYTVLYTVKLPSRRSFILGKVYSSTFCVQSAAAG